MTSASAVEATDEDGAALQRQGSLTLPPPPAPPARPRLVPPVLRLEGGRPVDEDGDTPGQTLLMDDRRMKESPRGCRQKRAEVKRETSFAAVRQVMLPSRHMSRTWSWMASCPLRRCAPANWRTPKGMATAMSSRRWMRSSGISFGRVHRRGRPLGLGGWGGATSRPASRTSPGRPRRAPPGRPCRTPPARPRRALPL